MDYDLSQNLRERLEETDITMYGRFVTPEEVKLKAGIDLSQKDFAELEELKGGEE